MKKSCKDCKIISKGNIIKSTTTQNEFFKIPTQHTGIKSFVIKMYINDHCLVLGFKINEMTKKSKEK